MYEEGAMQPPSLLDGSQERSCYVLSAEDNMAEEEALNHSTIKRSTCIGRESCFSSKLPCTGRRKDSVLPNAENFPNRRLEKTVVLSNIPKTGGSCFHWQHSSTALSSAPLALAENRVSPQSCHGDHASTGRRKAETFASKHN